jgi:hypothetical protein
MKCNDCIYEKMCESRYEREHCLSFKDKANFVEVVRCKDCKHLNPMGSGGYRKCLRDNLWKDTDDFCSRGERSENGKS